MIELLLTNIKSVRGVPQWSVPQASESNIHWLGSSQALDWLWQQINASKKEFVVVKKGKSILIGVDMQQAAEADTILFAGSAKEVVQQLRPYMVMMEGM